MKLMAGWFLLSSHRTWFAFSMYLQAKINSTQILQLKKKIIRKESRIHIYTVTVGMRERNKE